MHPTNDDHTRAAMRVFQHALGLFVEDGVLGLHEESGVVRPVLTPGTHRCGNGELLVCLHVEPNGDGQLEIMRAAPPPTAITPRLFVMAWRQDRGGWVPVFERGTWEAEILAATGPAATH